MKESFIALSVNNEIFGLRLTLDKWICDKLPQLYFHKNDIVRYYKSKQW